MPTEDAGSASLDQHDRDVRDDRIDQLRVGAVEPFLDHRLFVVEVLAVLLHQLPRHSPGS